MRVSSALQATVAYFALLLASAASARGQAVLFVDRDAPGANNGTSWPDAFTSVQDALAAVVGGVATEIRVAHGIYKPDQGRNQTPGDRSATFQLLNAVALRGGYAGFGEPDPNARDFTVYETVLSGDLEGDDEPNFVNNEENSYHVVTSTGTVATSVLEGFTITAGNADGSSFPNNRGGGLFNSPGGPTITACVFDRNAGALVGAVYNGQSTSNPTFTNCRFSRNMQSVRSFNGAGAVWNSGSSATFRNCVFERNEGLDSAGAIQNFRSSPVLIDCRFLFHTGRSVGAIENLDECHPTLRNCTFIGNSGSYLGAFGTAQNSNATLENCVFVGNFSPDGPGAIRLVSGLATISRCVFVGNGSNRSAGALGMAQAGAAIQRCTFAGNESATGVGALTGNRVGTIGNCKFVGNRSLDRGAGAMGIGGELALVNLSVIANSAAGNPIGGVQGSGSHELVSCVLWGNRGESGFGENAQYYAFSPMLNYSCIQGWTGNLGGAGNIGDDPQFVGGPSGIWTAGATYDPMTAQVTFVDASASWLDNEFAGQFLNPDSNQMLQTVIVRNTATTIVAWGDFAALGAAGAAYQINDYHLAAASPCVDTGDPNFILQPGQLADIDGELRVWDGDANGEPRVDMGADEFGSFVFGDLNCDGRFDGADIDPFFFALGDPITYEAAFPNCNARLGDMNLDGSFNGADIDPFFACLGGGNCP